MPEEQAARAAMPLALAAGAFIIAMTPWNSRRLLTWASCGPAGSSLVVLCALLGIYANLDLAFDPNW